MARPLPPLIPPFRHCLIEDGLYRGAHPSLKNMRFMRRLKLQTILSLVPEATGPSRDLREYCEAEHIRLIWHQVDKYNEGFSHTPQLVASILSRLIDPRNHPLFMHCRDGGHNTGLVVMCLRRLQNWSLPSIHEEFRRYTKSNEISYKEKQFVESFHATVSVPIRIPAWLWEGVRHRKHPSIQLELETDPDTPTSLLRTPNASDSRDAELTLQIVSPQVERQGSGRQSLRHYTHKLIQTHCTSHLEALDLTGIHFVSCLRPSMYSNLVENRNHKT